MGCSINAYGQPVSKARKSLVTPSKCPKNGHSSRWDKHWLWSVCYRSNCASTMCIRSLCTRVKSTQSMRTRRRRLVITALASTFTMRGGQRTTKKCLSIILNYTQTWIWCLKNKICTKSTTN